MVYIILKVFYLGMGIYMSLFFYLAVKIDLGYLGFLFLLLGAGARQGGHVTVETLAAAKYLGRHIKRHPRSF